MKHSIAILFIFLLFAITAYSELSPISFGKASILGLANQEALYKLVHEQNDVYRKSLKHYLQEFVYQLHLQNLSTEKINERLFDKFVHEPQKLWIEIREYMFKKLFAKFDMEKLSESFKSEIKRHPDDYFLTFEMYDLLHDWTHPTKQLFDDQRAFKQILKP